MTRWPSSDQLILTLACWHWPWLEGAREIMTTHNDMTTHMKKLHLYRNSDTDLQLFDLKKKKVLLNCHGWWSCLIRSSSNLFVIELLFSNTSQPTSFTNQPTNQPTDGTHHRPKHPLSMSKLKRNKVLTSWELQWEINRMGWRLKTRQFTVSRFKKKKNEEIKRK